MHTTNKIQQLRKINIILCKRNKSNGLIIFIKFMCFGGKKEKNLNLHNYRFRNEQMAI